MLSKQTLGFFAAFALIAPLHAQSADGTGRTPQQEYQRGYAATPMPNQAAVDAQSRPAVAALNNAVAADQQTDAAQASAQADVNRAQYDADRAAYMDALIRHDAHVDRAEARWRRQQNAYADAMAVWRVQANACKRGDRRACNAPTPNPADFY